MAKSFSFSFTAEFSSGKSLTAYAEYLVNNIKENEGNILEAYYSFCLVKLLECYHEWLSNKFKATRKDLEEVLDKYEDSIFMCTINGVDYILKGETSTDYTFDRDALKDKKLTFKDGSPVKDMTGYARYLEELDLPVPNFIHVSTKTICSLDKKLAAVAAESEDDLIKAETTRKFKY